MPSNITAASHGGPIPATSISCPVDGEKIKAADISAPVAALLANDDDLYTKVADITPDLLAGNNTWTGTNTYSNTLTANGAITQTNRHTKSGAAATTRQRTTNASVGTKISVVADVWAIPTPLVLTPYTLDESTVVPLEGEQITVWRGSTGAFDVELRREDTALLATLPSGVPCGVTFTYYASSSWRITGGFGAFTIGTSP